MQTKVSDVGLDIIDGPNYSRDDEGWEHNAYTLRLSYRGRTMDVQWRASIGITDDPTPSDVMESLCLDASGFLNSSGFEDWAADFGFDSDSRKAEAIYKQVDEQTEQLRDLLGADFEDIASSDETRSNPGQGFKA